MKRKLIYLILILLYIFLIYYFFNFQTSINTKRIDDIGSINLYFCQQTNCANILVELINNSKDIKCAFYDLGEPTVLNALNKTNTLIFNENYEGNFTPVTSKGLMHHKFCVFDEKIVLTGSWNPTIRGTYYNDNLVLLIVSKEISKAYLNEYNKLLKNKKHQANYLFNLSGNLIDLCFSPEGNCESLIINEIKKAKKQIKFLTFTFTSQKIAEAILNQNISHSGVIEKTKISQYTVKLNYTLDTNKYNMHHKSFIIDEDVVILGSYNPTQSANTQNDENLLVIRSIKLNELMKKEFERIYN
ncbi:MAG: phospholipase D-like domain-containing protein [Candidatus Woesearchaeota archaeon]